MFILSVYISVYDADKSNASKNGKSTTAFLFKNYFISLIDIETEKFEQKLDRKYMIFPM